MRQYVTLIEKAQTQDPELTNALETWTAFYSKADAYTGAANEQERKIIELASRYPCTYRGMLYRGQAVEDDVIPRLLAGQTVEIPPLKRLIASWSKDEQVAYAFARDDYENNFSTLLIRIPSSKLELVVDTDEWITGYEGEIITKAQTLHLTRADVLSAWQYNPERGQSELVWGRNSMRHWINIVEAAAQEISIDDLPITAKQDLITMLLTNCPAFKEYWMREQSIMSFTETYVAQFIFGTEDLQHSAQKGYADQPFEVRAVALHPHEIDSEDRPVSDNVVTRYAALTTEAPPILVRRIGTKWRIVEGGHRLAAAKANNAKTISAYDVSVFFEVDWDTIDE